MDMDRNTAIRMIRTALKRRSGKSWSVTGGRGTAWGWITIASPPARSTARHRLKAGATLDRPQDYEEYDSHEPGHSMLLAEREELARLLGLEGVHQDVSIPASTDYRIEYVDRAEGRPPRVHGVPYWD